MLEKVSQMNHSVVKLAEMHAKMQRALPMAVPVKCSMLFALLAEKLARFLSSQEKIAQCIAATALQIIEHKLKNRFFSASFGVHFFYNQYHLSLFKILELSKITSALLDIKREI